MTCPSFGAIFGPVVGFDAPWLIVGADDDGVVVAATVFDGEEAMLLSNGLCAFDEVEESVEECVEGSVP